jgi:DnaJ domain
VIDYSRHYATLRITRDVEWSALRARYKRLIGQWHPDRFPVDTSQRELAEEHSKEITTAYHAIERYYRDHGVLPPMEPAPPVATPGIKAAAPRPAPNTGAGAAATDAAKHPPTGKFLGQHRALIVISAIALATYGAFHYAGDESGNAASRGLDVAEVPAPDPSPPEPSHDGGGITAGSTIGEVYSIQGIPTQTRGDTWYYGKSSIRFAQGKVVSWSQHPDNPLRVARDQPVTLRDGFFDIGSTKDEVRSVQGTPVTETETVWDYGTSRVYFENNRVVRWETTTLQPLHVPR